MKHHGFTLIELLAVIVILAIILAIAVPSITSIVSKARKNAFEDSAKLLLKAMINQKAADDTFSYTDVDKEYIHDELHIDTSNYQSVAVQMENNIPSVTIVGQNKWDGLMATGTYDNITISDVTAPLDKTPPVITLIGVNPVNIDEGIVYSDAGATALDDVDGDVTIDITTTGTVNVNVGGTYTITYTVSDKAGNIATATRTINVISDYVASEGVNKPKLVTGMTAIKWNGSSWDTVSNPNTDTSWYDYTNKEWANAKTSDGSYWVWIPRYAYKIGNNWHSNTVGTIDVAFSMGTDDTRGGTVTLDTGTTSNASNNKWTNHPAFTFGTTELTGIWVAKFEATASEGVASPSGSCIASDNVTTKNIKIMPSVSAWRCINIGNLFTVSRNMETSNIYGWGTSGTGIDTHLIKNIEWGAVTYLSKSIYGQNTNKMWINPAGNYYTGCAGDTGISDQTGGCTYTYETTNGVKTSTTGNIYGVYDMAGGTWEYVASYINNTSATSSSIATSIVNADVKYKDIYTTGNPDDQVTNYGLAIDKKGDAIYETSSTGSGNYGWFGSYSRIAYSTMPWMPRGCSSTYADRASPFSYAYSNGDAINLYGFRPTLLIKLGL